VETDQKSVEITNYSFSTVSWRILGRENMGLASRLL
jgi:hypothetical protein